MRKPDQSLNRINMNYCSIPSSFNPIWRISARVLRTELPTNQKLPSWENHLEAHAWEALNKERLSEQLAIILS